jgi:GNAT superfamily N-acetyltransferase
MIFGQQEQMTTMQSPNIRQAHPGDAPVASRLRLEALCAHPEAFASDHAIESARSPAEWEAWVGRADGRAGILYLAQVDQEWAGMAALFRGPSPKTQHSATISGVYVRPAHRRKGIGTALIQACVEWARAHGVDVLKLGVSGANATAIRFYACLGFHVYGVEPRAIRVRDREYNNLLMALEL